MTGSDLKRERLALGLSQIAFAALVGVTQAQVSQYERVGRRPLPARPATVRRILDALQTNGRPAETAKSRPAVD
jgi:transcriptional regulator with XRE-family HTH domain